MTTLRESVEARRQAATDARHKAARVRMAAFLAARAARAAEAAEATA